MDKYQSIPDVQQGESEDSIDLDNVLYRINSAMIASGRSDSKMPIILDV